MSRFPQTLSTLALLLSVSSCLNPFPSGGDPKEQPKNRFQTVTGGDADDEREGWNAKYKSRAYVSGKEPDPFLKQNIRFLPKGATLLFPMEEGKSAIFLAKNGFQVSGIDYSDAALQKAHRLARENHVKISGINADLEQYEFEVGKYDVIVGLDLFRPRLVSQVKSGLKKNGVILYTAQMATAAQIQSGTIPSSVVRPGELKAHFLDFQIIHYHEESEKMAYLVARKP